MRPAVYYARPKPQDVVQVQAGLSLLLFVYRLRCNEFSLTQEYGRIAELRFVSLDGEHSAYLVFSAGGQPSYSDEEGVVKKRGGQRKR